VEHKAGDQGGRPRNCANALGARGLPGADSGRGGSARSLPPPPPPPKTWCLPPPPKGKKVNREFGFLSFSTPDEAATAIRWMHGAVVEGLSKDGDGLTVQYEAQGSSKPAKAQAQAIALAALHSAQLGLLQQQLLLQQQQQQQQMHAAAALLQHQLPHGHAHAHAHLHHEHARQAVPGFGSPAAAPPIGLGIGLPPVDHTHWHGGLPHEASPQEQASMAAAMQQLMAAAAAATAADTGVASGPMPFP
jgi:hypothetical protein